MIQSDRVMMTIGSNPRLTTECDSNVLADDEVEEVPLPPDGGWGWLIVLSSFMCNLILDGRNKYEQQKIFRLLSRRCRDNQHHLHSSLIQKSQY